MSTFDVFVSYHRADTRQVTELAGMLSARGVRVWYDQSEIPEFGGITRAVTDGISQSKAFLSWYSKTYPARRACQWELTAAYIGAQQTPDGMARLLVVNPETTNAHIQPRTLLDRRFLTGVSDSEGIARAAANIADFVAQLPDRPKAPVPVAAPQWYPFRRTGSAYFIGRIVDLWQLDSRLHEPDVPFDTQRASPGVAIVTGLGGAGKSLLVEEYALRFGGAFPAGIFWLDAGGAQTQAELEAVFHGQIGAIAAQLNLPVQAKTSAEIMAGLRDYFAARTVSGLWVVDDFPIGMPPDALRKWFAPHPNIRTVVTTRSTEHGEISVPVRIGRLPDEDAHALLTSRVQPSGPAEREAMKTAACELGNHALALDVAAGALTTYEGTEPFRRFVGELGMVEEDALELAGELTGILPNGHERSIAATLLGSIRKANSEALDFLRLASLLASAPIPEIMALVILGLTDRVNEMRSRHRWRLAARDLHRLALSEKHGEPDGENSAWAVHSLVARTVRFAYRGDSRVEAIRQSALYAFSEWLNQLNKADAPAGIELAHARKLSRSGDGIPETNLLQFVTQQDEFNGAFAAAVDGWSDVVARVKRTHAPEDPVVLTFQSNLAIAMRKRGDVAAACDLHRKVLAGRLRILGPQDEATITSMDNLGVCLNELGEYQEAAKFHRDAVNSFTAIHGPESKDTLIAMANLGRTLWTMGQLDNALPLLSKVLELRAKHFGYNHPSTLRSMTSLGDALRTAGQLRNARQLLQDAAAGLEVSLGPENPLTLEAKHNLAVTLKSSGDNRAAEALAREVYQLRRKQLGEHHPDTLLSLEILCSAGSADKSELGRVRETQQAIVDGYMQSLGPEHPHTACAQNGLGVIAREMGDLAAAGELCSVALATLAAKLGPHHFFTTAAAWNLYLVWEDQQRERGDMVELVNRYLAWLMSADPRKLVESQRDIAEKFSRTSDGMFRAMKARLFGTQSWE